MLYIADVLSNIPLKRLEHHRHDHTRNRADADIYYLRQNYCSTRVSIQLSSLVSRRNRHAPSHYDVSPRRPPPCHPHSSQTQQSSPVRIPTGRLTAPSPSRRPHLRPQPMRRPSQGRSTRHCAQRVRRAVHIFRRRGVVTSV